MDSEKVIKLNESNKHGSTRTRADNKRKLGVSKPMMKVTANEEGKDKMIRIVDTGWLAAKKAEEFGSPKTIKILVLLVVIVALIRGIALVIHLFLNH